MCLVLEVGKVYINALGGKFKIVSDEAGGRKPMIGVKADTGIVQLYQRNGQFLPDSRVSTSDLYKQAPTPHPHAESMMLYAQDAAECEKPWLRWSVWECGRWSELGKFPCWVAEKSYRRLPQSEWPPEAC